MDRLVGDIDSRGKRRFQTVNNDPSETLQSDAHLADIQQIMNTFWRDGMEILNEADLQFRDISEFTDLADALNQAREAEVQFLKLPSKVREVFDHDVAVWLDSAHDKDKRDALVAAGFIKGDVETVEEVRPPVVQPSGEAPGGAGAPGEITPG